MEISYSSSGSGGLLLWKEKVVGVGVQKGLLCKWKRRYLGFECLELMISWKLRRKMMVQRHDQRIDAEFRIQNDFVPKSVVIFVNEESTWWWRMFDEGEKKLRGLNRIFAGKLAIISHCLHNFLIRIHSFCWYSKSRMLNFLGIRSKQIFRAYTYKYDFFVDHYVCKIIVYTKIIIGLDLIISWIKLKPSM